MSTLLEVAKKCMQADGPNRDLDVSIVYALHPDIGNYQPHCQGDEPIFWQDPYRKQRCPKFTASMDAAETLFPDNTEVIQYWILGKKPSVNARHGDTHVTANGNTKALALCAAALELRVSLALTSKEP